LALSRQNLPLLRTEHDGENRSAKGGYVVSPAKGAAKVTLVATGSEVALAMDAQTKLAEKGVAASVVSMPCTALFDAQPQVYRDATIPKSTVRIAVEAGGTMGWERYVGETGAAIGMTSFGASAPIGDLYKHFGITADAVVAAALSRL
jgi:transketolase